MARDPDSVAQRGTKAWRQAEEGYRDWIGEQVWEAAESGEVDPYDRGGLSAFLATLGVTPQVGGGRHAWKLFMGKLPGEGFSGTRALEQYRPAGADPAGLAGMHARQLGKMPSGFELPTLGTLAQPQQGQQDGGSWSDWTKYGLR